MTCKRTSYHPLSPVSPTAWALLFALALICCGERIKKDSVFESLDGNVRCTFRGGGVVDYQEGTSVFAGKYSYVDNDRVRVELSVLGTSIAMLLEPTDRGLVQIDDNGQQAGILFDANHIEPARCDHLRRSATELIADFQNKIREGNRSRRDAWHLRQVQALGRESPFTKETLQAGPHYALHVERSGCGEELIWDSKDDKTPVYLLSHEAESRWSALAVSFAEEQAALEAEAKRQEEERAAAAARYRERVAAAKLASEEIGRFEHILAWNKFFPDRSPTRFGSVVVSDAGFRFSDSRGQEHEYSFSISTTFLVMTGQGPNASGQTTTTRMMWNRAFGAKSTRARPGDGPRMP